MDVFPERDNHDIGLCQCIKPVLCPYRRTFCRPDKAGRFRTYPAAEECPPFQYFPEQDQGNGDMKRAEPFGDHYRNGDGGHALAPGLNRDGFTIIRSGNPFLDLVIAGIRQ